LRFQEREQLLFVPAEFIETAVERVLCRYAIILVKQVAHGAGFEPIPVQPPFAARIQQSVTDLCFENIEPRRAFAAGRKSGLPEPIQPQLIPQFQSQPAAAPLPWMTQCHLAEAELNGIDGLWWRRPVLREKTHLLDGGMGRAIQHIQRQTPLRPLRVIYFAKIQKLTLD